MTLVVGWLIIIWGVGMLFGKKNNRPSLIEQVAVGVIPTATPIPMRFGVMADVHNDTEQLKLFLDAAKSRGIELVIIAGDLTIDGSEAELRAVKKVLEESGVRYLAVPGNHDHWGSKDRAGLFTKIFGADYQSFYEGSNKVILINNGSWRGLGDEQWRWIQNEVRECRKFKCVAIAHMPLNHGTSEHIMGENSDRVTEEAGKLLDLLVSNNVKEMITGHLHYSTSYELQGLRTTIAGAVSRSRNTQGPRYTEFTIQGDELNREVVVNF